MSQTKCQGVTKSGQKCKRTAGENENFCWQHRRVEKERKKDKDAKRRKIPKPKKSKEAKVPEKPEEKKKVVRARETCCIEGCKQIVFKGGACTTHSCHQVNCNKHVVFGTLWCPSHKCQYPNCVYQKLAERSSCTTHKCWESNCNGMKLAERHYCQQHTCSVKTCKISCGKGDLKKRLCHLHQKQYALDKPDECAVCLEELKSDEEPWPCGHYIHRACITQSLKAECPMCRTKLKLRPEEERVINNRSRQAQVERNEQLIAGLNNQVIANELRLRFGPAYDQILMIMAGLPPQFIGAVFE